MADLTKANAIRIAIELVDSNRVLREENEALRAQIASYQIKSKSAPMNVVTPVANGEPDSNEAWELDRVAEIDAEIAEMEEEKVAELGEIWMLHCPVCNHWYHVKGEKCKSRVTIYDMATDHFERFDKKGDTSHTMNVVREGEADPRWKKS